MALEGFYVAEQTRREVSGFIEKWHYSKNINGCIADFCFGLFNPLGEMVGAMFFGRMAMANQYKRFHEDEKCVIELRRLCCVDDTPKNAESFFIARALKLLRRKFKGVVVSYADKEYGHSGVIYKASNFKQLDDIKGAKVIIYNGKQYHDKAIRTKYKGELKPFARRIKDALDKGDAFYKNTSGKCTFIYQL
jgi:hypothetical protein